MEGPKGFRSVLAPLVETREVEIVEGEIRFLNGSKIYLCHCKDEKDRFKYQGAEIHVLMIDELTHFTEVIYRFLRGRVRAVGLGELPSDLQGAFPRILLGSNPGGVGHLWVKKSFIDGATPMSLRQMGDSEGGMVRQYIPARLNDNPSMTADDPTYRARLRGLGAESLVKAMEDGDWTVLDGAYFEKWSAAKHIIAPFEIPKGWQKFRSFDWGSAAPFSCGWWAISDGSMPGIQKGALVRFMEWYGSKNHDNTGLKLNSGEVAAGIKEREADYEISFGVADPSIFAEDDGDSIATSMRKSHGIAWKRADNKRVPGWNQLRRRLTGNEDGPQIFVFSTCVDSIRTIPALQHDPTKAEDLDTRMEDHAADEWRYACMARTIERQGLRLSIS